MLAKKYLESAMASYPARDDVDFQVRWRPFMLNPDGSKTGVNKYQAYVAKFGQSRVESMIPVMTDRFAAVGLNYSMGGNTGSTVDSHRLATFALRTAGAAKQNELMEKLFLAYFTEEKFLGDKAVLEQAATSVGLDAAEVLEDDRAYLSEMESERREFGSGVTGVPFFIFDEQFTLSGAQPPETLTQVFDQLLAKK